MHRRFAHAWLATSVFTILWIGHVPRALANGFDARKSCVTAIADLDADGVGDVLVANRASDSRECVWAVSAKSGRVLYRIEGRKPGDNFGCSLAELGDVDRDGVSDFVVGAIGMHIRRFEDRGGVWDNEIVGRSYVRIVSGKTGHSLREIEADRDDERLGIAVAPAGDVDGDGVPDLLVGNPWARNDKPVSGGAVDVYSGASGKRLRRIAPVESNRMFGSSVALIGDVDGDGKLDWAVGDPGFRDVAVEPGKSGTLSIECGIVYLLSSKSSAVVRKLRVGSAAEFGAVLASWIPSDGKSGYLAVAAPSRTVHVFDLGDGSTSFVANTHDKTILDDYGSSIALTLDKALGDAPVLVVGANESNPPGFFDSGYAEVCGSKGKVLQTLVPSDTSQGVDACALADFDGDGRPDFACVRAPDMRLELRGSASPHPREVKLIEAKPSGSAFAWVIPADYGRHSCVTSIGDLDGDGARDILIANKRSGHVGCVWAVSSRTGDVLYRLVAADGNAGFGCALASLGDLDGDHVPDFAVGSVRRASDESVSHTLITDPTAMTKAGVLLVSGRDGRRLRAFFGPSGCASFGRTVSSAGDADGDGIEDLLVGALNPKPPTVPDSDAFLSGVVSGVDGKVLRTLRCESGRTEHSGLGASAALVADVDGDGRLDWAVGAPQFVGTPEEQPDGSSGAVFVYSSKSGRVVQTFLGQDGGQLGFELASWRGSEPSVGCLAMATLSRTVRVWDFAGARESIRATSHAHRAYYDGFGTSLDLFVDRDSTTVRLAVGAGEDTFFDEGYAEVWTPNDAKPLVLLSGVREQGIDLATLGDVDGDQVTDFVLVFIDEMRVRIVSGAKANVLREFTMPLETAIPTSPVHAPAPTPK